MKQTRHLAIGIGIAVIGMAAALAYTFTGSTQVAPNVEYTPLDGKPSRIADLKGKVVLLNFWATSCTTCVKEMPQIVAMHQKYHARGYDTLAVAMSYDPPAYVINFAESRKLPFTVVIDNVGKMAQSFGDVKLTPTSILINKRGEIVRRYVGEPDFTALHQLVEKLLAET